MKALIFGRPSGYLASLFAGYWEDAYHPVFADADVRDRKAVIGAIDRTSPTLVLNAAGKTHGKRFSNIDGCEESAEQRDETHAVNVVGAINVRDACAARALPLVHLGSGCVYDGFGLDEIDEDRPPNPVSWYGQTKAHGDAHVAAYDKALVLRLRMPFGQQPHPRNLLVKLASYSHIVDAPNSITYLPSLLSTTTELLMQNAFGVYNVVQPYPVSPYRLASLGRFDVQPWTPEELNAQVRAPRSNCVLSVTKLKARGIWPEPVHRILGVNAERIAWQAGSV